MEYRVESFNPSVTEGGSSDKAADELEGAINDYSQDGWQFKSLQSMNYVARPSGCLAFLGRPENRVRQFLIFERED